MPADASDAATDPSEAPLGRIDPLTGPLVDEVFEPEVVSSDTVYDGMVWHIRRDAFRYGGDVIRREYVDHTGAVAVLALDAEGRVLVIRQYRHPIRAFEWELPAGLLDIRGEDPLTAAQRELAEEVDLEASEWHVLVDFLTSPGGSDEALRVYLARDVTATAEAFARTDEEADIVSRWVDLEEIVGAVLAGRVQNSILGIAALAAHASREQGWATLRPADEPWTRHPKLRGVGTASDADGSTGSAAAGDALAGA